MYTYIDKKANLKMAIKVLENAKMRNTSICGATETVLFHEKIANKFINPVLRNLKTKGCLIYGDKKIRKIFKSKINFANKRAGLKNIYPQKFLQKSLKILMKL